MQFEPYHLWAACAAGLGWCLYRIIYNLFLHPLSGIPGPKLAACSRLWFLRLELSGRPHEQIMELHKKYGMSHSPETPISRGPQLTPSHV